MLNRALFFGLKALVSIGLVWWALRQTDVAVVLSTINGVSTTALVAATVLAFAHVPLGAIKWQVVLQALSCRLPVTRVFEFYYASLFLTQVLPGAVATDAVRVLMVARSGATLAQAFSSVVLERVATVYTLLLLVTALLPVLLSKAPGFPVAWMFPALLLVGTAGLFGLLLLRRLPASMLRHRIVTGLVTFAQHTRQVLFHPVYTTVCLGLALLSHLNLALIVFALALGSDVEITLLDCLALVPPVILLTLLPVSVAGWGVRETSMIAALGLVGVEAGPALAISLLLGLLTLVSTLPGALFFIRLRGAALSRPQTDNAVTGLQSSASTVHSRSSGVSGPMK